ncbi:MAG TPA: lysylphosphatidylglycerol synthase transmembrane domain-containing protein [Anaerolineales bacterium]|nr:lysylphosphatidylglycerol synthase transmembrane domain-containing protein [Anaerolineales bacterium]
MKALKSWKFWFGLIISALSLYLVLRKIDYAQLWSELSSANYWWILPGVGVYFIGLWVRAWRWHYLLRPLKVIPTRTMFPIVTIGYAGNNIFPARAGEVVRAVILKRKEGVPFSASFATIIVERVFDGIVMLAFVFVNLSELGRLSNVSIEIGGLRLGVQDVAVWGSVAFFGALATFLAAAMFPAVTERILTALVTRFIPERIQPKVLDVAKRFLGGLESLRSPFDALMVFFTSVIIWLLETVKYWFVMHAFGFTVSFFALMLMNGVVNLMTTIPSAPGYLGTFDLPGIAVLEAYNVAREAAASYTFVLHLALWFPVTALGLYFMAREGINWTETVEGSKGDA